ncbi:hypothetical protein FRC03_006179 [Tulasnella sp. 419]|nr:hypothetical protein FRC03_006179 [Tulasnella sp. 419]
MLNPIIAPLLKVFKVQGLFVHFEHIPQQKSLTRLSTMMGEAELSAMAYSSYVERLSFLRHLEELELLGWPWPPPGSESELRYSGAMEICLPFLRRLRLCMVEPDICLLLLNVITGTPDDIALELDWHWQPSSHDDYLCPFINNLFAQGTLAHAVWQRVRTLHLSILPDTSPGGLYHVQLRGWHVDTMEPNPHSKANLSLVIASDIMEPMLHNMNLSDIKSLHTLQPYVPPLSSFPSLEHLSVKWWYGCGRFLSQLAPTLPSDSSYQEDKQLLVCPRLRTLRVCGNDPSLHLLLQIITCRQMHQATNKLEGSALAGLERLEIGTNANESDENVVSVVEMLKEQLGVEGVQLSRYSDHVYQL